jgi:amino acid transporter
VAVSVSSGVAQLASAFPVLHGHRVAVAVTFVIIIMVVNLRDVKESGTAFAIPSYFFIVMMFLTVSAAFARLLAGRLGGVVDPPHLQTGTELAPLGSGLPSSGTRRVGR